MKLTAETTQAQFEAAQVAKRARAALKYANMSGKYAFYRGDIRFVAVRCKNGCAEVKSLASGTWERLTSATPIDIR